MGIEVRVLGSGEEAILGRVAPGVFDHAVDGEAARAFLADPRHHLAVAVEDGVVVGFASGVHYFHPDKPAPEMFVNEVGVAPTHRGRGTGKEVLGALLARAGVLGCREAWVLTGRDNLPAQRLYLSRGGVRDPEEQVMFTFAAGPPPGVPEGRPG
ncbi:MAG: GNAT family N-acetyltransferase [Planctomycetes bacterium]|nr:GNAT family N-acetyltransferase [Planctomycetota bacterium]